MSQAVIDRERVFGTVGGAIERIAPGYFWPEIENEHLARYRWAANSIHSARILDAACGTGYGATILMKGGGTSLLSLDLCEEALSFGQKAYSIIPIRADAEYLPFKSASFDVVVSFETIEHLGNPDRFLKEALRVLTSHGYLFISTPNRDRSYANNPYHLQEFTLRELIAIIQASGFKAMDVRGQRWRLRGLPFERLRGFRRLAAELHSRVDVWRFPRFLADPLYWCIECRPQ